MLFTYKKVADNQAVNVSAQEAINRLFGTIHNWLTFNIKGGIQNNTAACMIEEVLDESVET